MRTTPILFSLAIVAAAACRSTPPVPPPAPVPLSDSAVAALGWVQTHTAPFAPSDSVASAEERARIFALTSGARIIGFSELTEGTHEFPLIMRRALFALADSGVRGVALQASMAEAMELDRYVRGGSADVRRTLRNLNPPQSERISTRETAALVEALREWNRANPTKQIGFYGFEIPTASRAVQTITTLPDSIVGAPLKSWLAQRYACVAMNEGAQWGREGRAADSTFWSSCGPATTQALDSVIALRSRAPASRQATLAYAEQMARLIQHHVSVGLRRLARQEGNAEHVMFLANMLGSNARLVLWGGDVEMGRLTLDKTTVQTGVALGQRLGAGYRAIAFTVGDGVLRARVPNRNARGGELPGLTNASILPPSANTYEDVLIRATPGAYWLDLRNTPPDIAGAWLKGPRGIRLITEVYVQEAPAQFETPVSFPENYDGVVFVKHATPARPY
jgi:erythromycin esterase-like protein